MNSKNIRIVLVETSHPGNIGAVARAMKNMCLSELMLVNPKEFPSPVAKARATGADDVLENATVCQNLDQAIGDCELVIGASARLRSVKWPELDPKNAATKINANSSSSAIAILFGREDFGLSNAEMDRCHYLLHIPTNKAFQSLNIAAAVQVICYEIYQASLDPDVIPSKKEELVSSQQLTGFFNHLESALEFIGFLKPPSCQKLMRRLKRLFYRAELDETDINILRGILSAAEGKKYQWIEKQDKN